MDIQLENNQKGVLWSIMEKYEKEIPSFSDSICKLIINKHTDDDLMNISSVLDSNQLDDVDSKELDKMLGIKLSLLFFEF